MQLRQRTPTKAQYFQSDRGTRSMFAIAPTDLDWFEWMRGEPMPRVVNFWTPTPWGIKRLSLGDRLYFMLKAPIRKIGGYGTFVRYVDMTASEAWTAYGTANGVASRDELVRRIEGFAKKRSRDFVSTGNPLIGCIELSDVITLDEDRYIGPDEGGHSFPDQVVKL